jgi:hypothetical protein
MSRFHGSGAQQARTVRGPLTGALMLLLLLAMSSCSAKIGDPCLRGIDCSQQGERSCDLSYRVDDEGFIDINGQGECTIDGCAAGSCPSEAICVRVFGVKFLSIPCDPELEDQLPKGASAHPCCDASASGCNDEGVRACVCGQDSEDPIFQQCCADEGSWSQQCARLVVQMECATCPLDDCLPSEVCLDEGLCVDTNTARGTCRKECSDDDSCRDGYVCRQTGANGIYAVPEVDDPDLRRLERICVPRGY